MHVYIYSTYLQTPGSDRGFPWVRPCYDRVHAVALNYQTQTKMGQCSCANLPAYGTEKNKNVWRSDFLFLFLTHV